MENEQVQMEGEQIKAPDYTMPSEKKNTDLTTVTIRLKKGLLKDYTALCKLKGTDRSKRIRNFMIYELKKGENIKAESSPTEKNEKPKDLNTGVSTN